MTKPVPQRLLLIRLKNLVDAASARGAGTARDQAKVELREVLATENWNTVYILYNCSARRCRYLRSIGYPVPTKYMFASENDVERIVAYNQKEK